MITTVAEVYDRLQAMMNLRESMSGRRCRICRSARLRSTRNRILFAALVVIGLTSAYLWVWNVRNRHLHKAALLVSEATSVITSDASADWVWSVKTNLLSKPLGPDPGWKGDNAPKMILNEKNVNVGWGLSLDFEGFFCCNDKKSELETRYRYLYSQAVMKSASYDSDEKNQGGVYPR